MPRWPNLQPLRDGWVDPNRVSSVQLARSRAIVATIFGMMALSLVLVGMDLYLGHFEDAFVEVGGFFLGFVVLGLLAWLRDPVIPGHLVVATVAGFTALMMNGGTGLYGNSSYYLLTIPMLAAMVIGPGAAAFWGGGTVLGVWVIYTLHVLGYFPAEDATTGFGTPLERAVNLTVLVAFTISSTQLLLWVQGTASTDLHRLVGKLELENQERRRAESEARAAEKTASRFLATMSHEIRTPLHGVIGSVNLIDTDRLPPDQRELVRTARSSSDLLLTLINDVLDYSRLEAGQIALERVGVDLRQLALDSVGAVSAQAEARRLQIDTFIAPGLPPIIAGDPVRLRQVLINLLANAVKFTSHGRVDLRISAAPAGKIAFIVRDTGIGMSPETVSRLFRPFVQADASTTRRFGGTGLGLAIVLGLTEAMKGTIEVNSVPGQGSTFTVTLPLTSWDESLDEDPSLVLVRPGQLRILVVDDTPVNRRIVRKMLEADGHDVIEAEDGEQAVASEGPYDLVLMDVHMPGIDGLEATRRLKRSGGFRATAPVIGLSASTSLEDRAAALAAGMDEFLGKPIRPNDLRRVMARYAPREATAGPAT